MAFGARADMRAGVCNGSRATAGKTANAPSSATPACINALFMLYLPKKGRNAP
jgi:hypothetical protein